MRGFLLDFLWSDVPPPFSTSYRVVCKGILVPINNVHDCQGEYKENYLSF